MIKGNHKRLVFQLAVVMVSLAGFCTFQWETDLFIRGFGGGVSATTLLILAGDLIAHRQEHKYLKVSIIMMLIACGVYIWSMFSKIKFQEELQKQYPSLYNQVSPEQDF